MEINDTIRQKLMVLMRERLHENWYLSPVTQEEESDGFFVDLEMRIRIGMKEEEVDESISLEEIVNIIIGRLVQAV